MNTPIDDATIIGNRLYGLRKKAHLSQSQMADKLSDILPDRYSLNTRDGYTNGKTYISRLENVRLSLPLDVLAAYSIIFDVSADYILGLTSCYRPEYSDTIDITPLSNESVTLLAQFKKYYAGQSKMAPAEYSLFPDAMYDLSHKEISQPQLLKMRNYLFGFINHIIFQRNFWIDSTAYLDSIITNEMLPANAHHREVARQESQILKSTIIGLFAAILDSYISNLKEESKNVLRKQK